MLELSGVVILGIMSQWIAWRMKIPAILPLIFVGLIVGPLSFLYLGNSEKLLEPIWNGERGLFPNKVFYEFVSLAIAIILFEGGLTLKRTEVKSVGKVIGNLITLGAMVTFFMAGIAAHYLFNLSWSISFLFSSLIIVTGPTVITPILRNIPVKKNVSTILKWEGILIDPIGALVAVLVYEFITNVGGLQNFTFHTFLNFFKIILIGSSIGFSFANALAFLIKRRWIPHYLLNVVSLCCVLMVFIISNMMAHESGLLSVVIMGMVLGNKALPNLKDLLYFKETLSVFLISILFIMLSANIKLSDLYLIYDYRAIYLFLIVILIIRPIGVFLSARHSSLKLKEKLFISWVGPRGIVAAGVASLFGQRLLMKGVEGASYITPLVFMMVLGTVLLNATTARLFAKLTRVFISKSEGIMIIGGTNLSCVIGKYLMSKNRKTVIIDNNLDNVNKSESVGLESYHINVFSDQINNEDFNTIGYLLALTPNHNVNEYVINKYKDVFGEYGYFRVMNTEESNSKNKPRNSELISCYGDFSYLSQVVKQIPVMSEFVIEKKTSLEEVLKMFKNKKDTLPMFLVSLENKIDPISTISQDTVIDKGAIIAYIGNPLEQSSEEKAA